MHSHVHMCMLCVWWVSFQIFIIFHFPSLLWSRHIVSKLNILLTVLTKLHVSHRVSAVWHCSWRRRGLFLVCFSAMRYFYVFAQYKYGLGKTAELNDCRERSSRGSGSSEAKAFHFTARWKQAGVPLIQSADSSGMEWSRETRDQGTSARRRLLLSRKYSGKEDAALWGATQRDRNTD